MEQIIAYVRRIVQIMIQATDLAHLLYRGHPSRKKTRAMQNFNMASIFHYGRHGPPWNHIFALKGQQMVEKDNDDKKLCVLSIENVQLML